MAQQHQVGRVATSTFADDDGFIKIVYHSTKVVAFNSEKVVLNSGGWRTATTKTRMNQASSQHALGYRVFQKDFAWFVDLPSGETVDFADGMEINR